MRQLISDKALSVTPGAVELVRTRFIHSLRKHIEAEGPFPIIHGAIQIIDRLNKSDKNCVAIATGCWRESANLKLETSGFDLPGIPMASCDDSISRTQIMSLALKKLNCRFDSVTHFGDREWDERAWRHL